MDGRTMTGKINQTGGGVARNIADALGKLNVNPYLISAVGDEPLGSFVLDQTIPHLSRKGITKKKVATTGTCMVLCDHTGECLIAVGDMSIHQKITAEDIKNHEEIIRGTPLLVLDGNLSQKTTEFLLRLCHENSVPVWFEPTDVFRAATPFLNKDIPPPSFISPNFIEFKKIFETVYPESVVEETENQVEECIKAGYKLAEIVDNIIVTLGKKGVLVIRRGGLSDPFFSTGEQRKRLEIQAPISHRVYHPDLIAPEEIVNVSGAGDCFASGFIAAMLRGETEQSCIKSGFKCSSASLKSSATVPETFGEEQQEEEKKGTHLRPSAVLQ